MDRQHVLIAVSALVVAFVAGCGAPVNAVKTVARQHQASVPVQPTVNRQHTQLELEAPASGSIAVSFNFPNKGYALQATPEDVAKITVALKTRAFLLTKTVATAEVTRAQMLNNKAAVEFTGLKAGNYSLEITALDAGDQPIGTTTASTDVADGEMSTVEAKLKIDRSIAVSAVGGGANLGVDLEIVNG